MPEPLVRLTREREPGTGAALMPATDAVADIDRFLAARFELLKEANPPTHGGEGTWRAILSPEFLDRLLAGESTTSAVFTGCPPAPPDHVAGIPFTVSADLPPHHLAVIFCGSEPFDQKHPERTVVITEREG